MPPSPIQRTVIRGVPYWLDTSDRTLYYYEAGTTAPPVAEARIAIGKESTGLFPDWQSHLNKALQNYRTGAQSRARVVTAAQP